jgi:MYXO-CTERM domain-containing protein
MRSKKITLAGAILSMLLFAGSAVPAVAQTATDQTTSRDMDDHDGFDDWGLLGLLGLAGLLGRGRKDRTVVTDTRRV